MRYQAGFTTKDFMDLSADLSLRGSRAEFFNECRAEGYVETANSAEGEFYDWGLSSTARRIGTKNVRRIRPEAMRRLKEELMARVKAAHQNPLLYADVGRLIVFGSALDDSREDYGDIDVCMYIVEQERFSSWKDMWEALKRNEPRPYDFKVEDQLEKFLRNRSPYIHFCPTYTYEDKGFKGEIVYEAPHFVQRRPALAQQG
jgi:predicted nucleotidyltransferase